MSSTSSTTAPTSTNPSSSSSSASALPKLGPAWYRAAGGNKGGSFRPPPVVPLNDAGTNNNNNNSATSPKLRGIPTPATTIASVLHPRERNTSTSFGVTSPSSSSMTGGNVNSFSALLDDDDDEQVPAVQQTTNSNKPVPSTTASVMSTTATAPPASGRTISSESATGATSGSTSGPRPLFQRNSSSGPTQGRSLAELAAAAAPSSTTRTSSYLSSSSSRSNMTNKPSSSMTVVTETNISNGGALRSSDAPDGFRRSVDDPDKPVIRYTREKLLAMRPSLSVDSCPTVLKHLEGIVILADQALDPVSFDEFDADEIWAAPAVVRGGISRTISSGSGGIVLNATSSSTNVSGAPALKGSSSSIPPEGGTSASSNALTRKGSDVGGRWERGVALPPPGEDHRSSNIRNEAEASSADDLWDDPLAVSTTIDSTKIGAAADFSSFGIPMVDIMDGGGRPANNTATSMFDLATLSEAALKFEEEIHPDKTKLTDSSSSTDAVEVKIRDVNPTRPLASAGMTIRSGSGDHVNVFEDFDDQFLPEEEQPEVEQPTTTTTTTTATVAVEEPLAKESPVSDETATVTEASTTGVTNTVVDNKKSPVITPSISSNHVETASSRLMQMIGIDSVDASSPWTATGLELKPSFSLPRNPWGEPVGSVGVSSHEAEWKALQEAELQRQRQVEEQAKIIEEQKRIALLKLQQQEEERKRIAAAQQEAAARQAAAAAQQQQPSQVEMVLMERISTILENSWGKADLMTILTALHRDDARVIPLLPNHDALKALLLRHPNRIQIGRDPTYGVDVAALTLTNAQFASLQQQQQQQQEQQQEIQRQQQQLLQAQQRHHQQQQATAAAEAQARSVYQQQQQRPKVSSKSPWYYADPQGNIQGPFGGDEMRQWLDGGYFKEDLPISQNSQGPFRALSLYFPDWRFAFLPNAAEEQQRKAEEKAQQEREQQERLERERIAEKERLEREQQQRVEFEQRMERERASEKLRKEKESGKNVVGDQNASSVQLKMLLGLGGKQQPDGSNTVDNRSHTGGSVRPQTMATKHHHPSEHQSDASNIAEAATTQPVVAWGGAAQQSLVRKKSMSEIQQEEARVAARLAKEREAVGSNSFRSNSTSGGWANVAAAGTSVWTAATATVRPAQPAGSAPVQRSASPAKSNVPVAASMQQVRAKQQAQVAAAQKQVLSQKKRDGSNSTSSDDFGAKMSPALENWCREQLRKITGSEDLTLVSFCTTLKDDAEIHQYLVAYLGSSPQVNSFASEFINRKNGGKRQTGEEWETTGKSKARKGKKTSATSSK